MQVTVLRTANDRLEPERTEVPHWEQLDEYEGKGLEGVSTAPILEFRGGRAELYHFAAGGDFVMYSSPHVAFCQIVRGKGMLGLPDGRALPYQGPELYLLLPGTLHEWHSISEDTLLAVCVVEQSAGRLQPRCRMAASPGREDMGEVTNDVSTRSTRLPTRTRVGSAHD